MAKKVTKKELKAQEDAQNKLRSARKQFISDINEYWDDCSATARYYKSHNMRDKLSFRDFINDDEARELLHNRESLKDLKLNSDYDKNDPQKRIWDFIHDMNTTENHEKAFYCDDKRLSNRLEEDDFWMDDIFWDENQIDLYIENMKKFGYKRLVYTNTSTAVMRSVTYLTQLGAIIVGTIGKKNWKGEADPDEGLIFDITNC